MTIMAVALGDSFAFPLSFGVCVAVSGAVAVAGTGGGVAVDDILRGESGSRRRFSRGAEGRV